MYQHSPVARGFSLVEVLVTAAIVALVFGGLFGAVNGMIILISSSKAKAGATALAVERVEYIRSLPYNDVGTISGVPPGLIPQNATSTLNGITYSERVLVEYVDDVTDGFGAADTNGILADYKRVKIELSWQSRNASSSISLVTSIMPVGIESTVGGGTIRVKVFDTTTAPVANAMVRFYNDSTTSTIDTIRYTNTEGIAYLAGAPAAANYQITASKSGYSTDGTVMATTSNPNPTTQPIAVIESTVSTMNFQIDYLSALTIETVGLPTTDTFTDSFVDDLLVALYASTTRTSDAVELEYFGSAYVASGTVVSATASPTILQQWDTLDFTASTSAATSVKVFVYYEAGGIQALIPDGDLPGNSIGFSSGPVILSGLDIGVYDTLALAALLTTTDTSQTPSLNDWTISYIESQAPIANVDFILNGTKAIGANGITPIYKTLVSTMTDGSGMYAIPQIEWDAYTLTITDSSYRVAEFCSSNPLSLAPNTARTLTAVLHGGTGAHLRVTVVDGTGQAIPSASVELDKTLGGYSVTQQTSLCGQTAFYSGGLSIANDYLVTVSAAGFTTSVFTDFGVTSTSTLNVIMN